MRKTFISIGMVSLAMILFACNASKGSAADNYSADEENIEKQGISFLQEKVKKGVDFYATGNEPSWNLEMDLDTAFTFSRMGEETLLFPVSAGDKAQDVSVIRYRSFSDSHEMIITIQNEECIDSMSGEVLGCKTSVEVKKITDENFIVYKGCGDFLIDNQLNGKWELEQIQDRAVIAENYGNGLPFIQIDALAKKVSGKDGCNNIFGTCEVQGNRLIFGMMAGSMMACPDMKNSDAFMRAISNRTLNFKIEDEKLILFNREQSLLIFHSLN